MNQYQSFIFDSYSFDESAKRIELRYALDDEIRFTETLQLPEDRPLEIVNRDGLDRALFMLHLIGGISYYKTCLPKNIQIRSGSLGKDQAEFWKTVYEQGLGEFFYRNEIDFRGLINFPASSHQPPATSSKPEARGQKLLVPIGGGKDSIVTIELLKKSKLPMTLLRVGSHPFIHEIASVANVSLLTVDRRLDPQLFKLNADGALNGHVPITAYLSILSIVLSELYGFTDVAFSDERSADEGNTEMYGMTINHQWSKSLEFEKALRAYLQNEGIDAVEYFSLLRPLSELHIVQQFTRYPQYFEHFTSCNANWKILSNTHAPSNIHTGRWCGQCPKCTFAFALCAAFLPKETVINIFETNLFADASLLPLYRELLGIEGIKPFECVGTPEETYAALSLADESGDWDDTPIMDMFHEAEMTLPYEPEAVIHNLLNPSSDHCVPEQFRAFLPQ